MAFVRQMDFKEKVSINAKCARETTRDWHEYETVSLLNFCIRYWPKGDEKWKDMQYDLWSTNTNQTSFWLHQALTKLLNLPFFCDGNIDTLVLCSDNGSSFVNKGRKTWWCCWCCCLLCCSSLPLLLLSSNNENHFF
jgi:hypothetical protein